jgi:hypothetical protein
MKQFSQGTFTDSGSMYSLFYSFLLIKNIELISGSNKPLQLYAAPVLKNTKNPSEKLRTTSTEPLIEGKFKHETYFNQRHADRRTSGRHGQWATSLRS